jgi:hypothetical protein
MAVWGDRRRRAIVLPALLCLAALLAVTTLRADAAPKHPGPDQTQLILRFSDLVLGYMNFDFGEGEDRPIFCSQLTHPEDTPPKLKRFVLHFHPRGCIGAYFRVFVPPGKEPGPRLIGTGVMALDSDRAADAAWRVAPELLGRLLGDRPLREVDPDIQVGSATRLFHAPLPGEARALGRNTSFLLWRSGNTLAVVETFGPKLGEDDRGATELAPLQQAHIENPTRYTGAERYDAEVPLDDPALETPVYWLGRNFKPNGLPSNRLFTSFALDGSEEEEPGALLGIWYEQIRLYTWTQATWHEYASTPEAHAIASWRCTKTKTIGLPSGYATIYGGYRKNYRRCPAQAPQAFTARVYVGDLVIAVNPIPVGPPDPPGSSPTFFIETGNPYGSFEGMEAIVRSLQLRPKPVYPAP